MVVNRRFRDDIGWILEVSGTFSGFLVVLLCRSVSGIALVPVQDVGNFQVPRAPRAPPRRLFSDRSGRFVEVSERFTALFSLLVHMNDP